MFFGRKSPAPGAPVPAAPRAPLEAVQAYHAATRHAPNRYARSLGYLDWETQPDPFRRYAGAPLLPLELSELASGASYDALYAAPLPASPVDRDSVSRLFFHSLALSAWKQYGPSRWSLRVDPSSGNLHPTEGYLIAGGLPGLHDRPAVYHYAPHEHGLELRCELESAAWSALASRLPAGSLLVGISSIYWRESWKYGERAFRYCQHDAGHVLAAVTVAAAALGWQARLLEGVADPDLAVLLGIAGQQDIEAEHPEALILLCPHGALTPDAQRDFTLPRALVESLARAEWQGTPNRLSPDHVAWPIVEAASEAATRREAPGPGFWHTPDGPPSFPVLSDRGLPAGRILRQRRSAVALDGQTRIDRETFYRMLLRVMPGTAVVPFRTLPWRPEVHLGLFVHQVDGLRPGLYTLVREPAQRAALEAEMQADFLWSVPEGCPASLPLFLQREVDCRSLARHVSCGQDIAADGVFALGMLARFEPALAEHGAWFYKRLHWEAGTIGQVLYLEAEAAGIRGTGIGCFFDDSMHQAFGLRSRAFQSLYHFTVGGPVEDGRLQTHPPYAHLVGRR